MLQRCEDDGGGKNTIIVTYAQPQQWGTLIKKLMPNTLIT